MEESDAMDELVRLSAELGLYDLDVRPCACGRAEPCRHCTDPAEAGSSVTHNGPDT